MSGDEFDYSFRETQASFRSASQSARVWTENWVLREMYCPACGDKPLTDFENNTPVADFFCALCNEEFELKSKKSKFGKKVTLEKYFTVYAETATAMPIPEMMLFEEVNSMVEPGVTIEA